MVYLFKFIEYLLDTKLGCIPREENCKPPAPVKNRLFVSERNILRLVDGPFPNPKSNSAQPFSKVRRFATLNDPAPETNAKNQSIDLPIFTFRLCQ